MVHFRAYLCKGKPSSGPGIGRVSVLTDLAISVIMQPVRGGCPEHHRSFVQTHLARVGAATTG
jgi:hypothetical protein